MTKQLNLQEFEKSMIVLLSEGKPCPLGIKLKAGSLRVEFYKIDDPENRNRWYTPFSGQHGFFNEIFYEDAISTTFRQLLMDNLSAAKMMYIVTHDIFLTVEEENKKFSTQSFQVFLEQEVDPW